MRLPSLVGHVVEVFSEFRKDASKPADAVIRKFFFQRKYLGSKDRRFISDAYYSIIKYFRRLESIAIDAGATGGAGTNTGSSSERTSDVAIVAAYLIAVQSMPPAEVNDVLAEVHGSLPPKESLWPMADRSREIERLSSLPFIDRLATAYSFPRWFVERLSEEYGAGDIEPMLTRMNEEAPTVLRTNTLVVANREELADELRRDGCQTTFSHIAQNALLLDRRANVQGFNSFKRGAFEIQDEASQLVAPFANVKTGIKLLDACAGAGGKTLHFAALLRNRGEIFATDPDPHKLEELKKRVKRSTAQNVRIVWPEDRDRVLGVERNGWFDLVLLDVPCTGTGTLRRNPGIKWVLTEQMLAELMEKQYQILIENSRFVKPGGRLVYATCSILKEEGEGQVERFVRENPEFECEEIMRTLPNAQGCDAFFAARLLRKTKPVSKIEEN
jgi:16S rRNA (cytosine967-C5)-methyltransferase